MRKAKFAGLAAALFAAFISLVSVYAGQSGAPSAEKPVVVSAAAPWFPSVAKAAKAFGDVVVEVEVNASGAVSSARAVEGHPLLRKVSEDAASRWKFAGDEKAGARRARLTFSFRQAESRDDEAPPSFEPPYRIVVVSVTPCIM
jgi:TonB family protein